jgi:hypothetical protein
MHAFRPVSIALMMTMATVAGAADFDGTKPLTCTALQAHDCLPTSKNCSRMKPDTDIAPIFSLDFAKKELRSPFRTALLKVVNATTNEKSIVLQGADLLNAWSTTIDQKTGAFTVAMADAKGAYVAFGQCKVTGTP